MYFPGQLNIPDPKFIDGVNLFINSKPLENPYIIGSWEYALLQMGYNWAKHKNLNKENAVSVMNNVRNWFDLDDEPNGNN